MKIRQLTTLTANEIKGKDCSDMQMDAVFVCVCVRLCAFVCVYEGRPKGVWAKPWLKKRWHNKKGTGTPEEAAEQGGKRK